MRDRGDAFGRPTDSEGSLGKLSPDGRICLGNLINMALRTAATAEPGLMNYILKQLLCVSAGPLAYDYTTCVSVWRINQIVSQ